MKLDPSQVKLVLESAAMATDETRISLENISGGEHHARLVGCAQALKDADLIDVMDLSQVGKPYLRMLKPRGRELLNKLGGRAFRRIQMSGQPMTLEELQEALNTATHPQP
jgi:hypothetical protein